MSANIYCFSGLGADETLFANIQISGYTLKHIQWLPPLSKETLPHYAKRLTAQIAEPNPILMGVSFGGMLALEAAHTVNAQQTILISSIQAATHFPFYYHWANRIKLSSWAPSQLFVTPNPIADYLFGTETAADKKLLHHYMCTANVTYIRWALWAIINWQQKTLPPNMVHIHGTADRIIPLPKGVNHTVKGGGHLMVYNRAATINALLNNVLPATK